jgi:hypothetical protein
MFPTAIYICIGGVGCLENRWPQISLLLSGETSPQKTLVVAATKAICLPYASGRTKQRLGNPRYRFTSNRIWSLQYYLGFILEIELSTSHHTHQMLDKLSMFFVCLWCRLQVIGNGAGLTNIYEECTFASFNGSLSPPQLSTWFLLNLLL